MSLPPESAFCASVYDPGHIIQLTTGHVIMILCIMFSCFVIFKLTRRLDYFLIKERAPRLALAQSYTFLITVVLPYGLEIADTDYDEDEKRILWYRKLLKSIYATARATSYIIFILR